jgi:hypothetical protein
MYLRIFIFFNLLSLSGFSQVFDCEVQVIAPTLQNNPANEEIFSSLKNAMVEFVNYGYAWTPDTYEQIERINLSFLLTINSKNGNNYSAKLQITSQRPVYNSDYRTMLFNYVDEEVTFQYLRNSPVQYFEGQHVNNLADVLAFYIYMVLGYDYDSFALEGGTPYFTKADQIVSICQSAAEPGWKSGDGDNNRFWLIQNSLQPQFAALRKCYYNYHLNGLDKCNNDRVKCLESMSTSLNDLMEIHQSRPSSFNMQLFFNAKSDEIIKIYLPADKELKLKIYNLLAQLDPSRIKKYNKLK